MKTIRFWVGNYASPGQEGVSRYRYVPLHGFEKEAGYTGLTNPSFLLEHPALPVLYTVEETEEGAVCAWREESGRLLLLGRVKTGGASPCHLSLSGDGEWLYCANYMGGSVSRIRLDEQGIPVERTDLAVHHGRGPNPWRQEAAHAHCVYPYGNQVGVCDLGEDRIYLYENREGKLAEIACLRAEPGSGPRHLASHASRPGCLYCVSELSGAVYVWKETGSGDFSCLQGVNTLPQGFDGENTAAAIRFAGDGKWLLVSHRGADGIAAMPVRTDGSLGAPVWSPCVRGPRDFVVCGNTVLAASQRDGEIRAYELNDGRLTDTGFRTDAPEPVCLQKALR